jgi:hypothetical protein
MSSEQAEEIVNRVTTDRQWPAIVRLKHPVDFGSERITSLEFRRGRMGDLKGVKVDGIPPVDQLMLIASRMCGQPIKALEMLEDEDGAEVLEIALVFFARCLGGGKKR